MKITIGIDIGGSTTKIVGFQNKELKIPTTVKADNPIASLFGALGKFIYDNNILLHEIEKIMITGVGSAYVEQPLYSIPTYKVNEFTCNGLGLSSLLLKTQEISKIMDLASRGNLENIDLQIQDISKTALPGLPMDATTSNFGKVRSFVSDEDMAIGIINMVLQAIGKSAILSSLNSHINHFVMTGNLARFPQCKETFKSLENLFDVHFIIPSHAEYSTAIGAALTKDHPMEMIQIM